MKAKGFKRRRAAGLVGAIIVGVGESCCKAAADWLRRVIGENPGAIAVILVVLAIIATVWWFRNRGGGDGTAARLPSPHGGPENRAYRIPDRLTPDDLLEDPLNEFYRPLRVPVMVYIAGNRYGSVVWWLDSRIPHGIRRAAAARVLARYRARRGGVTSARS